MARKVNYHQLADLSNTETPNEILLDTKTNTELHIIARDDKTVIKLPFGNKYEIIYGCIVIHEK